MWTGLWQKRCKYPETAVAIAYEQHGFFEQAQVTFESVSIHKLSSFIFQSRMCHLWSVTEIHPKNTSHIMVRR